MPDQVRRAFAQLFPAERGKIQNPLRRRTVSMYDAARQAIQATPAITAQSFRSGGEQLRRQMQPGPHRPSLRGMTPNEAFRMEMAKATDPRASVMDRMALADMILPGIFLQSPIGKTLQRQRWIQRSSLSESAGRGLQSNPSKIGLRQESAVIDPKYQEFYEDARGVPGGNVAAYTDYAERPGGALIGDKGRLALQRGTGMTHLPEDIPSFYVNYTHSVGDRREVQEMLMRDLGPDEAMKRVNVWGGAGMQTFLKDIAQDYPDQLVAIEAHLVQKKLQGLKPAYEEGGTKLKEVAKSLQEKGQGEMLKKMGLSPRSVVYDPNTGAGVFFAKNGKLVSVKKAVKEMGGDPNKVRQIDPGRAEAMARGDIQDMYDPFYDAPDDAFVREENIIMEGYDDMGYDADFASAMDIASQATPEMTYNDIARQLNEAGFDTEVINDVIEDLYHIERAEPRANVPFGGRATDTVSRTRR